MNLMMTPETLKETPQIMETTETPKTDDNKKDWSRRFIDPMMRWAWNNEIRVEPANKEKGQHVGFRNFPDGTREAFSVE